MKKAKGIENAGKMRRIMLSKQFCITVLVVMVLLALICTLKVVLGFVLPVKQFTCEGDTHYDILELASASGIKEGDKLYKINKSEVEERILKKCPYVKSVEVDCEFPDTVCFVIEEKEPGWYIEFGGEFFSLDYDMGLLVRESEEKGLIERGLTKLVLPDIEEIIISENPNKPNVPIFSSDDEYVKTETLKIIDTFRTHVTNGTNIKNMLTKLDLSNRFQIKFELDNSFEVDFGEMDNFDTKMETLLSIIERVRSQGYMGAEITYTTDGAFGVKPILPEIEEEETAERSE